MKLNTDVNASKDSFKLEARLKSSSSNRRFVPFAYDQKREISFSRIFTKNRIIIHPTIFDLSYPIGENLANLRATELSFDPFLLSPVFFFFPFFLLFYVFSISSDPFSRPYPRLLSSPPSPSFPSYPETREDFAWSGCTPLLLRATDIIANEITPSCESYSTLSRCASSFRALLRDGCISVWRREREREREILSDNDAFVHYNCSKRLVLLCNYTLFDDERVSFLLLAFKCKNSECIRDLKSLWRVALANFIFPKWTYYERLRTRRRNFEKCVW